jgi:hypothetical protein
LSHATEIYNELATAAKEMGLEIKTSKTKLLIRGRREDKKIQSITFSAETAEAVKTLRIGGVNTKYTCRRGQ